MIYKKRILKSSKNRSKIHTDKQKKCNVRNETQWKQNALYVFI